MATLQIPSDKDYSGDTLSGIDTLEFLNAGGSATVWFNYKQFDGVQILPSVQVTGSADANHIVVMDGSVDASGWTFSGWTAGVDTITLLGGSDSDVLAGSSQRDIIDGGDNSDFITGGLGADDLRGGSGTDGFIYNSAAEMVSGETVDGGSSTDTLLLTASGFYQVNTVSLTSIERIQMSNAAGAITVAINDSQLGAGAITQISGSAGTNRVNVFGTAVDLTAVSFTNGIDLVEIEITASGSYLGSFFGERFNQISAGIANMIGSGGDDEFLYQLDDAAGDTIFGGDDTDTILMSSLALLDLTGASIGNVEILQFDEAGASEARLLASQLPGFTTFRGTVNKDGLLVDIAGTGGDVDLSGFTFDSWTAGDDLITVTGNDGANTINGTAMIDRLIGGLGVDQLYGNGGADIFVIASGEDASSETYNGGGGLDTIQVTGGLIQFLQNSTITSVERLEFLSASDVSIRSQHIGANGSIQQVMGSGGQDRLYVYNADIDLSGVSFTNWSGDIFLTVQGGNDVIGSGKADTIRKMSPGISNLSGGGGNDTIYYRTDSAAGDVVDGGGGGADTIVLDGTYNLLDLTSASVTGVERFAFNSTQDGEIALTLGQVNSGLTRIYGGTGAHTITINIANSGNLDLTTLSYVDWSNRTDSVDVNGGTLDNIITGSNALNTLTGGSGNDMLYGLNGRDVLEGDSGQDVLVGGTGRDVLRGGSNADNLTGGVGRDILRGDGGADNFNFDDAAESAVGNQRDRIRDFEQGTDHIDVSDITAFAFIGTAGFSGTGSAEIRYEQFAGTSKTVASGDVNGDGTVDFEIALDGLYALQQADFIL